MTVTGAEDRGRRIRLAIVEDHQLVAEALADMFALASDFEVVGLARSGSDAVELVRVAQPDVVLMDVGLVGLNGIEATRQITAKNPKAKVLVLTMHDDENTVTSAVAAGASGFMPKNADREALFHAVRALADGEGFLHERITRTLLTRVAPLIDGTLDGERLSAKESAVLQELTRGKTSKEIATALTLGEETVKSHLARIYQKLGVRDRTQAVVVALRRGLVT